MDFNLLINIPEPLLTKLLYLLNCTTEPFTLLLKSRGADTTILLNFFHSSADAEHHHMPYECSYSAGIHNVVSTVFPMLPWRWG